MDESSLNQLKVALQASPDNLALLKLIISSLIEKGAVQDALSIIENYDNEILDSNDLAFLTGRVYFLNSNFDMALTYLKSDDPDVLVLKSRVLLRLNKQDEGIEAYKAAIQKNSALEDPELAASLQAKVVEIPVTGKGPKLKVIKNDNTDSADLHRLIVPQLKTIKFDDVGGLDKVKQSIYKKIILPYQKPNLFQRFKKRVGGGILLYGPPGCGKTLLARATAGECKAEFLNVSITDVLDMYIGESERKLHSLFQRARESAPAVLFFDEVEALGGKRQNTRDSSTSKLVSQFLLEMDGFAQNNHGVLILAATNVPWSVDSAFRRPGRFDRILFIPPPDQIGRKAILDTLLNDRPTDDSIDTTYLSKKTPGFSGADLSELVETAIDEAIESSINSGTEELISASHFKTALKEINPTTLEWLTTARNYARYSNESGQYNDVLNFLKKFGK